MKGLRVRTSSNVDHTTKQRSSSSTRTAAAAGRAETNRCGVRSRCVSEGQDKKEKSTVKVEVDPVAAEGPAVSSITRFFSSISLWGESKNDKPSRPFHTSTPANSPYLHGHFDEFMDVSEIVPAVSIDFAALGAFGEGAAFLEHPDFDNDICTYMFHNEAIPPTDLSPSWRRFGSNAERNFATVMDYLLEVSYLKPLPTECIYLAAHYVNHTVVHGDVSKSSLEALCLAALHLASKMERQSGLSRSILNDSAQKKIVFEYEQKILNVLDFKVQPTTVISFMRLLQIPICGSVAALWQFAKFVSQLALCQTDLASLPASLLAGVVMRLVARLDGRGLWTHNMYAMMQQPEDCYDQPEAILCRLLLVAQRNRDSCQIFARYSSVADSVIERTADVLRQRARAAKSAPMMEKRRVKLD